MGIVVNIILFGLSFITLSISGGYSTNSAVRITKIPNYKDDKKLESAHRNLSIAAVITWITVAAIIIGAILFLIFGSEETVAAEESTGISFGSIIVYFLLGVSLLATGFVGVLSAIAAGEINDSDVPNKKSANRQAIIAAVLAIVGAVLILGALIGKYIYGRKQEKKPDDSLSSLLKKFDMGSDLEA